LAGANGAYPALDFADPSGVHVFLSAIQALEKVGVKFRTLIERSLQCLFEEITS